MGPSSQGFPPPIIRPARPADAQALSQLATQVFRHTYAAAIADTILTPYLARVFHPAVLSTAIHEPATQFFVAAQDDALLGYSKCAVTVSPASIGSGQVIELVNLYVDPAHQGRGIGKALLQQTMQHAMTQGFTTLWLCVWQANQAALRFYQGQGFTTTGTAVITVDGVAFDDWVMQKALTS